MNEIIEQLLSYLRSIWRYRWYGLGLAWLICLGGWAFIYKLPDQYQASARVYVDTQSVLRPLLQGMTVQFNPSSQIDLMTRTLLSRPNLEKVARMTDMDLKVKDEYDRDEMLNKLQQRIALLGAGRENLYTIAYNDRDPEIAKKVVQSLLTIFVEKTLGETRQDTDTAQRFLDKQISEYEQRLMTAENRLAEFKQKNAGMISSDTGGYYSSVQSIGNSLEETRLELQQAQNRRDSLRQQLMGEGKAVDAALKADAPDKASPVTLPIDERIKGLQQQLDNLLLKYTERHPDIGITRNLLEELKKQREKDLAEYKAALASSGSKVAELNANPIYQQLKIALAQEEAHIASLQARINNYNKQMTDLQARVNTVPVIEAQLKALDRDYNVTRSNYDALLARREQARLSQQAEQTTDNIRFRVIEPPRVPAEPSGPNRPMLISGVLGASLGSGIALAFLVGQLRPTFDSRRGLMQATNIPVFGSVGIIRSSATMRRERLKLLLFIALLALLLLLYTGLLVGELAHLIKF